MTMKRTLQIAALLVVLGLGVRMLVRGLAAEETKIRWVIEEMVAGFDDGHAGNAISGLAESWRHEGRSVERDMIRGFVFAESMQNRESETGAFRWDAELPEETWSVELGPEERSATVRTEVRFAYLVRLQDGEPVWEPRWHIRLEAELERLDGDWRVVRSRHEDLQGVMLGR